MGARSVNQESFSRVLRRTRLPLRKRRRHATATFLRARRESVILCAMKLSRASTYAFYGLSYLAGEPEGRFVPLSEIHERYGVPEKHLAKIFQALVKARLLVSARGVGGGFALARPASKISPLDVIQVIDGPIAESGCLLLGEPCEHETACHINAVWRRAQHAMLQVLRQSTLADMVQSKRFRPPRLKLTSIS
jgi:Rrf2 family protein